MRSVARGDDRKYNGYRSSTGGAAAKVREMVFKQKKIEKKPGWHARVQ